MNCKYCGKELEDQLDVCPECAEEQEKLALAAEETEKVEEQVVEETPKKKAPATVTVSLWKVVAATVVGVLLLVLLTVMVINSITGRNWPMDMFTKETTAATVGQDATEPAELGGPEDLGMSIAGITDIALYASDVDAAVAASGEVIATLGDYQLTNGQLQILYWMEFSRFVMDANESGYDLAGSYNLDIYKPMGEQLVVGTTVTWEQYFLHNALGTWWRYVTVNTMADEAGYEMSEEDKAELAKVPEQLAEDAKEEGFESAEALIQSRLGASCTMDDYVAYMELTARGDLYYAEYQKSYTPTDEDVEAFFELNNEYYTYYGITKEAGKQAAVRHILLVPEGATKDESTGYVTATDEQWAEGEKAAQALLDSWVKKGAKEEDFATLAKEHSTDGGSQENGGLYEGVLTGQMVEAFDAWVFDESRKPGDYGIVKTEFGHHLMYFVSLSEKDAWFENAYADAIAYGYGFNQELSAAMEANQIAPALDKIVLTDVAQEAATVETTTEPTAATE